jgi:hypothetical protein
MEKLTEQHHMIDGEIHTRHHVHSFSMGDVEDPELLAAQPLYEWQQTDKGSWVMKHCKDPTYHIGADPATFGYKVSITAYMTAKRYTEFALKFL